MTTLAHLMAQSEVTRELPMNAYVYGAISLCLFGLGLLVLWSFRGTANKVRDSGETHDFGHGPGPHGSGHH